MVVKIIAVNKINRGSNAVHNKIDTHINHSSIELTENTWCGQIFGQRCPNNNGLHLESNGNWQLNRFNINGGHVDPGDNV